MNKFLRWGKFSVVGAIGMTVQLATLSLLSRFIGGHYLYASSIAVEIAVLHNFAWHIHYTWRDRRDGATLVNRLGRFHLSNGLASLLGNLTLMRLFVRGAHMPLLLSNAAAILCCSIANFCLSDNWAFAHASQTQRK